MPETLTFDLHSLVVQIINLSETPDLSVLTSTVRAHIADENIPDALDQCLRLFVQQVVGQQRIGGKTHSRVKANIPPNVSWKQQGFVDLWERLKRDNIHVADGRKFLGDCTYDDLVFAAEERYSISAAIRKQGDRFKFYAEVVLREGVSTFGDLPLKAQQEVLQA